MYVYIHTHTHANVCMCVFIKTNHQNFVVRLAGLYLVCILEDPPVHVTRFSRVIH